MQACERRIEGGREEGWSEKHDLEKVA